MLEAESLADSLFEPQLLQQWLDGAGVELPPVNAVRIMCATCLPTMAQFHTSIINFLRS